MQLIARENNEHRHYVVTFSLTTLNRFCVTTNDRALHLTQGKKLNRMQIGVAKISPQADARAAFDCHFEARCM